MEGGVESNTLNTSLLKVTTESVVLLYHTNTNGEASRAGLALACTDNGCKGLEEDGLLITMSSV